MMRRLALTEFAISSLKNMVKGEKRYSIKHKNDNYPYIYRTSNDMNYIKDFFSSPPHWIDKKRMENFYVVDNKEN